MLPDIINCEREIKKESKIFLNECHQGNEFKQQCEELNVYNQYRCQLEVQYKNNLAQLLLSKYELKVKYIKLKELNKSILQSKREEMGLGEGHISRFEGAEYLEVLKSMQKESKKMSLMMKKENMSFRILELMCAEIKKEKKELNKIYINYDSDVLREINIRRIYMTFESKILEMKDDGWAEKVPEWVVGRKRLN